MLSRVAENVYWLSRYLERIESLSRLINVYGRSLMDRPGVRAHDGWMPLITISGLDSMYLSHFEQANEADVSRFLISDSRNPGSITNAALAIKNNLRSSRDILPKQLYERISTLVRYIKVTADEGITTGNRRAVLDAIQRQVLEISGAVHGSLRHDQAYKFMRMACYLERADMTTRVLDTPVSVSVADNHANDFTAFDHSDWITALRSVSAMQMYRKHVRQPVNAQGCLNFLLNDAQLPAACLFCFNRLDRCLEHFSNNAAVRQTVRQLTDKLAAADIAQLAADAASRHQFLDQLQLGMLDTGNAIADTYFPPPQESA